MDDEGPLGVSIVLCNRAVPIRAELATTSVLLGPERPAETLLGAQKRLGTAQKLTKNGCAVPSHLPLTLDNRSCHGVRWPSVVVSEHASERAPRAPFFRSRFLFIPKHQCFSIFRGTWYLICHLIGKTLWYEVLVTIGTPL